MAYLNGTATDYKDLLRKVRRFAMGFGTAGTPTPGANTGNGTVTGVDTHVATITETWTLTCTATATDGGTFSVVGSVSGAQASATVGTPYSNSFIDFTINDGSTDFAINDSFTIATTIGAMPSAQRWQDKRLVDAGSDMEWLFMAPGLAGTDEIYGGIRTYFDSGSDYYNWGMIGTTGYVGGNSYSTQPGISGEKHVPLWNSSIPFWLVVNGRRMILVAKVSTIYESLYLGHFLPYGTPNQYPYPLAVGGMGYTANARWSDTAPDKNRNPFDPGCNGSTTTGTLELYAVDGTWIKMGNYYSSPEVAVGNSNNVLPLAWTYVRDNCDGASYALIPLTLVQASPENVLGEMDGVYWVSGFANASENIITISAQDYLVFQNAHRNGVNDYRALKLA